MAPHPSDHSASLHDLFCSQPAVNAVMERDTIELRQRISERLAWLLFPDSAESSTSSAAASTSDTKHLEHNGVSRRDLAPAKAVVSAPTTVNHTCPICKEGKMMLRIFKFGCFVGCSKYPECGWTAQARDPITGEQGTALPKARMLGRHPELDLEISLRNGPVGFYVQLGGNLTHEEARLPPPPDVSKFKVGRLSLPTILCRSMLWSLD